MSDRDRPPPDRASKTTQQPVAAGQEIPRASPQGAVLDSSLQAHIGRQLRALYAEIADQPVPDRFVKLLDELERKKSGQS
ncbi:NepR family anti-sigma factor [Limobrevibacterium gyesilva]|uniref:NepR family anti-sigma factor n=1 Tax=Limobrevibacterium gyesilva TaxID=2991712 RepID=A0AA41YR16_9PROT|nr:NepR family anti-sigma factor [Limobrevibacterium gyesilva]MCW3477146.1 NepR family anti-sigma factor [Limobrevibacterium gyesilva]